MVISHIAVFEACTDNSVYDFDNADDLTEGPYNLSVTPAVIEDAEFTFTSNVLGELNNLTITFTPVTIFMEYQGNI